MQQPGSAATDRGVPNWRRERSRIISACFLLVGRSGEETAFFTKRKHPSGGLRFGAKSIRAVPLLCSAASSVLYSGLTPPTRSRPAFGFAPDRPASLAGVREVSRFSCMLFLDVPWLFDHAASRAGSRFCRLRRVLPSRYSKRVGTQFFRFRGSIIWPADASIYASPCASRRTA